MTALLVFLFKGMSAQETDSTQTLFKSRVKVSELWTPEKKQIKCYSFG
jgi:hypothetical protein